MKITLQSDFYDEYVLGTFIGIKESISTKGTMLKYTNAWEKIMDNVEQWKY